MPHPKYLALLALWLVAPAARAAIDVPSGAALDLADGAIDLGCTDLTVAGAFSGANAVVSGIASVAINGGAITAGATQFSVGRDFLDNGSFDAGTSRVQIVDTCGNGISRLRGSSNFHDFVASTATGKQLVLDAATTQGVAHTFTLQGAAGNLLQVLSSAAGQQARFAVAAAAAQTIAYVNARDNIASIAHIAPGPAAQFNSVDAGNLVNWFAGGSDPIDPGGGRVVPTPALGRWATWLLAALLGALAWRRTRVV